MKNNYIIYFPGVLIIPIFASLYGKSKESILLGVISCSLLALFLYTIKTLGKQEKVEISELGEDSYPNQELGQISEPTPNPISEEFNPPSRRSMELAGLRKERFVREILPNILRSFLSEIPFRSKHQSILVCLWENGEFHEFLQQQGNVFIQCDRDAVLEADYKIHSELQKGRIQFSENRKKIWLPVSTPHSLYGAIQISGNLGFGDSEIYILEREAERLATEWEARVEYEIAILEPSTLVYNSSHFYTILNEKFHSQEEISLFLLEIQDSSDMESFVSYFSESWKTYVYRIEKSTLAFFHPTEDIEAIPVMMDEFLRHLDSIQFYAEFVLAYASLDQKWESSTEWMERGKINLGIAKKRKGIPVRT
jgi:hypothetical protein